VEPERHDASMDLNADLGELSGDEGRRSDRGVLGMVTTTHVACGAHAGDPETMRRTAAAAAELGVVVGAHPSYPDREGFGRRALDRAPEVLYDDVLSQLELLGAACEAESVLLRSVKAHGALYNVMAVDPVTAGAVARAVAEFDRRLVLVVPAASQSQTAAEEAGLSVVTEGFCDRAYLPDGSLAPRTMPGSLLENPEEAARQAVELTRHQRVTATDGTALIVPCQTLCIHGDSPRALAVATAVRRALQGAGVTVAPFVDVAG
jgi:5-oxoprolinase (ATP-hydrolysing) subunit A